MRPESLRLRSSTAEGFHRAPSLGHDRMSATEVSAEMNLSLARQVAAEMG
jgi:hypothetical protein